VNGNDDGTEKCSQLCMFGYYDDDYCGDYEHVLWNLVEDDRDSLWSFFGSNEEIFKSNLPVIIKWYIN